MSHRPFHPSELGEQEDPAATSDLLALARELERLDGGAIRPSDGFTDRVLIAIAGEPLPRPTAAAGLAARQGRLGAMLGALRDTWHVAWSGGRPLALRAQAMAFVLLLVVAVGSIGAIGTVGALNVLFPATSSPSVVPAPTAPAINEPTIRPTETPEPTETAEPTGTPEPTETPEPTDTPEPNRTTAPRETESPDHTDRPNRTETPEPEDTPDVTNDGSHQDDGHDGGATEQP